MKTDRGVLGDFAADRRVFKYETSRGASRDKDKKESGSSFRVKEIIGFFLFVQFPTELFHDD